jgi:hypothetical protein
MTPDRRSIRGRAAHARPRLAILRCDICGRKIAALARGDVCTAQRCYELGRTRLRIRKEGTQ